MTYTPDIREYQQLSYGSPTGPFDCTAEQSAVLVDAHTNGVVKTTGRAVRLHTDEPVPDPKSPGLNLPQVDEAVLEITTSRGRPVDLDTRVGFRSLSRADVRFRITDGRWAGIQVWRGVLVNRGFLEGFGRGHALTVHTLPGEPDVPIFGDTLVPHYVRGSWDALFDAAEALTGGRIYAQFTRDLTPDYHAVIPPLPAGTTFRRFHLNDNNRIVDITHHENDGPTDYRCTVPRYHGAAKGKPKRWGHQLVQITEPGARRNGWWISNRWAEELNP